MAIEATYHKGRELIEVCDGLCTRNSIWLTLQEAGQLIEDLARIMDKTKRIHIFAHGHYDPSGGMSDYLYFIDVSDIDKQDEIIARLMPLAAKLVDRDVVRLAVNAEYGLEVIWLVGVRRTDDESGFHIALDRPFMWAEKG